MTTAKIKNRDQGKRAESNKTEEDSAVEIRRQRKANEIRKQIREEWEATECGYRENKRRDAANFPRLYQAAEAAGRDFRQNGHRYGERQKTFRFYWKIPNCDPIKVNYFLTRFGRVALLPPDWCYHTRSALGLSVKKRTTRPDEWERLLLEYLNSPKAAGKRRFTTTDLLIRVLDIDEIRIKKIDQVTVGRIMKKLGWVRVRETVYPRRFGYVRPEEIKNGGND